MGSGARRAGGRVEVILLAAAVALLGGATAGAVLGAVARGREVRREALRFLVVLGFLPWLLHFLAVLNAPRLGEPDPAPPGPVPGSGRFLLVGILIGAALLAAGWWLAGRRPGLAWLVPPARFTGYYLLALTPFARDAYGYLLLDNTPNVLLFLLSALETAALLVFPRVAGRAREGA